MEKYDFQGFLFIALLLHSRIRGHLPVLSQSTAAVASTSDPALCFLQLLSCLHSSQVLLLLLGAEGPTEPKGAEPSSPGGCKRRLQAEAVTELNSCAGCSGLGARLHPWCLVRTVPMQWRYRRVGLDLCTSELSTVVQKLPKHEDTKHRAFIRHCSES